MTSLDLLDDMVQWRVDSILQRLTLIEANTVETLSPLRKTYLDTDLESIRFTLSDIQKVVKQEISHARLMSSAL